MASLKESVVKKKSFTGWSGSSSDLKRLLREIEKYMEPLIAPHVESETSFQTSTLRWTETRVTEAELRLERENDRLSMRDLLESQLAEARADADRAREALDAKTEEASGAGRIDLTVFGYDDERRSTTGTANELVDHLDGRSYEALNFKAPSGSIYNYEISITATRDGGVDLRVSSKNDQWATAAYADLTREIQAGVPRWLFLRNVYFLYFVYALASGIALWNIGDAIANLNYSDGRFPPDVGNVVYFLYITLTLSLPAAAVALTRKVVPAFEVVREGKRSKGGALVGVIGSAVGAVALGILTNAISSWIAG